MRKLPIFLLTGVLVLISVGIAGYQAHRVQVVPSSYFSKLSNPIEPDIYISYNILESAYSVIRKFGICNSYDSPAMAKFLVGQNPLHKDLVSFYGMPGLKNYQPVVSSDGWLIFKCEPYVDERGEIKVRASFNGRFVRVERGDSQDVMRADVQSPVFSLFKS